MKFFELEDCDGKNILVNAEQITSVQKTDDNCAFITLTYCDCVITRTPYEDFVTAIKNLLCVYELTHEEPVMKTVSQDGKVEGFPKLDKVKTSVTSESENSFIMNRFSKVE